MGQDLRQQQEVSSCHFRITVCLGAILLFGDFCSGKVVQLRPAGRGLVAMEIEQTYSGRTDNVKTS